MNRIVIVLTCLCLAVGAMSCKKEKGNITDPVGKYIVLTASEQWGSGYYSAYVNMPSGDLSNVNATSLQVSDVFGTRSFGSWIFDRTNAAGETGLQKYSVNPSGGFIDEGFIIDAENYVIVNETLGYYSDPNRGLMKLQTFNPTTMLRTGDLDLSSLSIDTIEFQAVGKHILAAKEGKLYVSVTYGTTEVGGYGDDQYDEVKFAVIDIATNTLDKTIIYEGVRGIGWGSSANKFWTLGDDGALYFYSPGFSSGITNSTIIRIKAGATDFDTWSLSADDYQASSTIATAVVKGGKLYTQFPNTALNSDFSNLDSYIFDYYAIDLGTGVKTKIQGIPVNHYAWANDQGITEIDGKIYFSVMTPTEKGYYVLGDNMTATKAFNITDGGFVWGLLKLN